jgi:hypothetical protein
VDCEIRRQLAFERTAGPQNRELGLESAGERRQNPDEMPLGAAATQARRHHEKTRARHRRQV